MTRIITITPETVNGEDLKSVEVKISGHQQMEFYSYPQSIDDTTITNEVNADLDAKGYPDPE